MDHCHDLPGTLLSMAEWPMCGHTCNRRPQRRGGPLVPGTHAHTSFKPTHPLGLLKPVVTAPVHPPPLLYCFVLSANYVAGYRLSSLKTLSQLMSTKISLSTALYGEKGEALPLAHAPALGHPGMGSFNIHILHNLPHCFLPTQT